MLILETERLILRDFRPDDFDAFFATTSDPEYQKFYARREMKRPFWQTIFDRILTATAQSERLSYQLAVCLPTGDLIGTSGVRIEEPTQHQQASFGCAIARDYCGSGYAFEASQYLIAYAFTTLPIHRIYAETISENKKARSLANRLGMRLEGEFHHHRYFQDRWWNTVIYAKLKEE